MGAPLMRPPLQDVEDGDTSARMRLQGGSVPTSEEREPTKGDAPANRPPSLDSAKLRRTSHTFGGLRRKKAERPSGGLAKADSACSPCTDTDNEPSSSGPASTVLPSSVELP